MSETRNRLLQGTYLDCKNKIIAHLYEEDTENTLVYIGVEQNHGFTDNIILIVEYFPEKLCQRDAKGKLLINHNASEKGKYYDGLNEFVKSAEKLSTGDGDLSLGVLVHYFENNGTAYRIHNWKDCEYRKKLKEVSRYTDIPSGYFPPNTDNFKINPEEVDMNSEPYSYLIKSIMDEHKKYKDIPFKDLPLSLQINCLFQLDISLRYEQQHLFEMIGELDAFDQCDMDYGLGQKIKRITLEDVDKTIDPSGWHELRLLLKPNDEFWEWFIPGECAGIGLYRNGRGFKTWVTLKT